MQSDWISAIFEDSKKRLWIGNALGTIYLFDRGSRKFFNYNLQVSQAKKINGVWQITEDEKGEIWLCGHEGYFKLEETKNIFQFYDDSLGIKPGVRTGIIYADKKYRLWLSSTEGIKMYDQGQKRLFGSDYNPGRLKIFDTKESASAIFMYGDTLWAFFERHAERFVFSSNDLKKYYVSADFRISPKHQIRDHFLGLPYILKGGAIILPLLHNGIAIYDPAIDDFRILIADNSKEYAYHDNESSEEVFVSQDRKGNIVIGNSTGLNISNPSKQLFYNVHGGEANNDKFSGQQVSDIFQIPSGDIFISYYNKNGGIVQTDSNLLFKKRYLLPAPDEENGVNQVGQLFLKDENTLLAPNRAGTVLELDFKHSVLKENKDSLYTGLINTMKRDGENIWLGTWKNGLQKIDARKNERTSYAGYQNKTSNLPDRVHAILIQENNIWLGTLEYGLVLMNKITGKTIHTYAKEGGLSNSISSNCVNDILDYHSDTLILATSTGINIFDIKTGRFSTITTREGLPANSVRRLAADQFGNVWATCGSGGLCRIDMKNLAVRSFSMQDGIINNIFNSVVYKLKNGKILAAIPEGFISFDPADFCKTNVSDPPAVTGIYLFNNWWPADLNNHRKALEFNYDQNFIRIEFSLLSLLPQSGSKIYYRLKGLDKAWIEADKSNTAIYNDLNSGNYVFEAKTINREGAESEVTSLVLTVNPPFYKTWWFLFLVIAAFIYLVWLLIKKREKLIRTAGAEKLQIQKLEADQYRSRMELEEIINFFSSSLIDKNSIDDVLWDVATNLIGKLGFEDCIIYLWNEEKTRMIQKAGLGNKNSPEKIKSMLLDVLPGQGIVGYVMQTQEPQMVPDTSLDARYRPDDAVRFSELTVPILHNGKLLGILDSEHKEKNFFTPQHMHVLTTVAALVSNKIVAIEAQQSLQEQKLQLHYINEQLYKTKLEALRSQMNPHFIFNSLNAIQECILTGKIDSAYQYLSKFSKLQRMVLNHSEKELIPLKKEIAMLDLYLQLESLRFSKSFVYRIQASENLLNDELMIPSMITQPFVENALWHGLRNKQGEQILSIDYTEKNDQLSVRIADNGIGRAAAEKIKKEKLGIEHHESRGTILMQNRLSILERQLNIQICLEIIDEQNNEGTPNGTTVKVIFPANL